MKKVIIILLTMIFGVISAKSLIKNDSANVNINNLNNFLTKYYNKVQIVKICTKDYCEYNKSLSNIDMINTFKDNYINSLNIDDDSKQTLYLKGFAITKIVAKTPQ